MGEKFVLEDVELAQMESIQNRLAVSLIKQARDLGMLKAKDWIQGGWSRSSANVIDTVNYGITPETMVER